MIESLIASLGSGSFWFGVVIGFVIYRTLKHTKNAAVSDIAAVVGAVGGGVVVKLFPAAGGRFDEYAIGLAVGFFLYFVVSLGLGLWKDPKTADDLLGDKDKKA
jgi:uncharacterized membrane protein YgaE (UPF0421/DUF939 family)